MLPETYLTAAKHALPAAETTTAARETGRSRRLRTARTRRRRIRPVRRSTPQAKWKAGPRREPAKAKRGFRRATVQNDPGQGRRCRAGSDGMAERRWSHETVRRRRTV